MFSFYTHRKKFFALSCAFLLIGILVAVFVGIQLDITFRGGSILRYSYNGSIDLPKAESAISQAIGMVVTCRETRSLGEDATSLVVSVAGEEALTPDEQTALQNALASAFPELDFELQEANLVDPFIGRELLISGLWAILIAAVLIVVYVWIRFRTISGLSAGVMALVALFHDVFIAFFAFVILQIPLNESVIAVVLSILGFSINDTIVIYDRIRENERLTNGKMPLIELVDMSIRQCFTRSINTSLCTFGALLVAYIFAAVYDISSIRNFALPMMIGVISGAYSSLALAGPLWAMWKTRKGRTGYESR